MDKGITRSKFRYMRKWFVITFLVLVVIVSVSFTANRMDSLRHAYSRSPDQWPRPNVDAGIGWKELGLVPDSPLLPHLDSLKHLIELGKVLFFDTRLSSSGKIACATCHQPELSWADGKEKSLGHEGAVNKRNSPSLQNVWFYKKLFWDGRSHGLEDQAFAPINSESEMHGDMRELPRSLRNMQGYAALFDSAYGDPAIDPDRIAAAIASFEKTIVSPKSRFDEFLAGKKNVLSNSELRGLHLFRTRARCMNCHHGALFTDNGFHNNGFAGDDKGLYNMTHKEEDTGKFKTPSLRDVMKTKPWMHDGQANDIHAIVRFYSDGKPGPGKDRLIKSLGLTNQEKKDLVAFLHAISSVPPEFNRPRLPG